VDEDIPPTRTTTDGQQLEADMPEDTQQEEAPKDPIEEFYGQFSEANRKRARRMYQTRLGPDGSIHWIDIVCTVHTDKKGKSIQADTVSLSEFREFLRTHSSVECPEGDTIALILPTDMEPSVWEKAESWQKGLMITGTLFLAFLFIFFGVRTSIYLVNKFAKSPSKYQTDGKRKGVVGEFQSRMTYIGSLAKKLEENADVPETARTVREELQTEKGELLRMMGQAKLRDKALVSDIDIMELEQKLGTFK
jgi:hypothetical protein